MTTAELVERMIEEHRIVLPKDDRERAELIEVVRRRIKNLADEYSDDFLRALRAMLGDYSSQAAEIAELRARVEALLQYTRHTHVAFYEDGKLTDKCCHCPFDLRDLIHVRLAAQEPNDARD